MASTPSAATLGVARCRRGRIRRIPYDHRGTETAPRTIATARPPHVEILLDQPFAHQPFYEVRLDHPGRDRVYAHPAAGPFNREHLREKLNSGLGRAVGGPLRECFRRVDRRDVDD